jgi:hypothetical protein
VKVLRMWSHCHLTSWPWLRIWSAVRSLRKILYSCREAFGCGTLALEFHRASPGYFWPVGKLS